MATPKTKLIKGKTSSGFEFSINPNLANDYRVIKLIAQIDNTDDSDTNVIGAVVKLIDILLGPKGDQALEKHVALEDGTVPTDKMMAEIGEIIGFLGENEATKN